MDYLFKLGTCGALEGQFDEPRGVAVNAESDIIVADTNNHRVQVFDRLGHFKLQFGGYGQGNGLMKHPHRVAVSKTNGNIIVLQRLLNYPILIYNMLGHFIISFGENFSSVAQAVTVDSEGKIIVVDCTWFYLFDQFGSVLHDSNFAHNLETPSAVVVSDQKEIFISDFTTHCVKVFNYSGQFSRQIGGGSVCRYPFGVNLTSQGNLVIGRKVTGNLDLTVFAQDGELVSNHKSKGKHAFCFGMATMDDGSVVISCSDDCLYVYRCT